MRVLLAFYFGLGLAHAAATADLKVTVTGFRDRVGVLQVILFDADRGFPADDERGMRTATVPITGKRMQVAFRDLPEGDYAVAVLHDADEDGEVDTNFIGIPTEGFAVSRNVNPRFRSPTFADAKFALRGPERKIQVHLVYR